MKQNLNGLEWIVITTYWLQAIVAMLNIVLNPIAYSTINSVGAMVLILVIAYTQNVRVFKILRWTWIPVVVVTLLCL